MKKAVKEIKEMNQRLDFERMSALKMKELKTGEHFTDLILWINKKNGFVEECKEDFEQICEIHLSQML